MGLASRKAIAANIYPSESCAVRVATGYAKIVQDGTEKLVTEEFQAFEFLGLF